MAGLRRPAARLRVPGQDAPGVPGGAGVRGRLPGGRAAPARPPDLADGLRGGHRRRRRLVDPGRASSPRRRTGPTSAGPPHNNILQLALGYNGLGRLTGDETGSIGGGGRRGRRAGRLVRRGDRDPAAVPVRVRRADQLAAARRADLAGRDGLGVAPGGADRPDPGRGAAVGRLGARHRPGVQLHARHHPPLLHGGARARHRRARRRRGDGALAGRRRLGSWPRPRGRPARGAGRADRGRRWASCHHLVGLRAARPDAGLAAVAALGDRGAGAAAAAGAGPALLARLSWRCRPLAPRAAGAGGSAARAGPGGRARRAGGVRAGHGEHHATPARSRARARAGFGGGPGGGRRAGVPAAGAASPGRQAGRGAWLGSGRPAGTGAASGGGPSGHRRDAAPGGSDRPGPARCRAAASAAAGTAVPAGPAAWAATPP